MGFPRAGSDPAGCAMQRAMTECDSLLEKLPGQGIKRLFLLSSRKFFNEKAQLI